MPKDNEYPYADGQRKALTPSSYKYIQTSEQRRKDKLIAEIRGFDLIHFDEANLIRIVDLLSNIKKDQEIVNAWSPK